MKITKIFTVEKEGDWIVANTPALDRDNDRIFPEKINVENFQKNPALFWGHNYHDPWAMIGKVAEWEIDSNSLRFRPELRKSTHENDPMKVIQSLWDNDLLRAASIGFIPKDFEKNADGGYDFGEIELLEISLVPIPAHQDALRMSVKALDDEYTGDETDPDIEPETEPETEPDEGADDNADDATPPTDTEPPLDESDAELDEIADDVENIAETLLEVLENA